MSPDDKARKLAEKMAEAAVLNGHDVSDVMDMDEFLPYATALHAAEEAMGAFVSEVDRSLETECDWDRRTIDGLRAALSAIKELLKENR